MSDVFDRPPILPTAPWLLRFLRTIGIGWDVLLALGGVLTVIQTPPSLDAGLGFYALTAWLWSALLVGGGTVSAIGTGMDRPVPQMYGSFVVALGAGIWAAANAAVGEPANAALACVLAAVVVAEIGRGVAVLVFARSVEVERFLRRGERAG